MLCFLHIKMILSSLYIQFDPNRTVDWKNPCKANLFTASAWHVRCTVKSLSVACNRTLHTEVDHGRIFSH